MGEKLMKESVILSLILEELNFNNILKVTKTDSGIDVNL